VVSTDARPEVHRHDQQESSSRISMPWCVNSRIDPRRSRLYLQGFSRSRVKLRSERVKVPIECRCSLAR